MYLLRVCPIALAKSDLGLDAEAVRTRDESIVPGLLHSIEPKPAVAAMALQTSSQG